jgi:hypothetical protein
MAMAATVIEVTITAIPGGLFAPTNFKATTITDHKITLTWEPNSLAVTTHIRAKVGNYPTSVSDGYEVYDGAGDTVDDNSVSLDETFANIHYIAYSVDGGGAPSSDRAEANTGGAWMTAITALLTEYFPQILTLLFFAIILALAYCARIPALYIICGIIIVLLGLFFAITSSASGNASTFVYLGGGMALIGIVTVLMSLS